MKKILTILMILAAATTFAQTDTTQLDSLENSYITAQDSPDSTSTEMTFEEMEELWAEMEEKKRKEEVIRNLIIETSGYVAYKAQDPQDYRNFYYRKKKNCRCR